MKIFFSLLLIANIAFGLMQWLLPYDQLIVEHKKIPVSEQLLLLSEVSMKAPVGNTPAEQVATRTETLVSEDTTDKRLCFTTGPFKDKTKALEVSGRYTGNRIKTEIKSSLEKEYLGIMVYIDGQKSRQAAVATAEALAGQGFHDYIIINEEGKSNALSLGVFGLKKNAERLSERLKRLKYPVETEARYHQRTIYWLYHQQSNESDLQPLLDPEDIGKGISQIPRDCT